MKIQELFDIDREIKVNGLGEVKSQAIYQNKADGLFSEEIFGQTPDERKYRCGYIKLPIHVFNPSVAKTIIARSGGIIRKMAYGEVRCDVIDGVLTPSKDGKYIGLKDLYDIWDDIDIKKTLSTTRSQDVIDILTKSPKRLIFNDKVLVAPPAFRPMGEKNGRMVKSELNTIYMHILGLKSVTSHTTSNVYQIYNKFQNAVINIYTFINNYISGKNGFLQKNLLAKNTMWSVRNVISAPKYNSDEVNIGIYRTGFPMHTVCSAFNPIITFQMRQFLSYNNLSTIHPNKNELNQSDITNIYDNKMISDLLNIYMKNPGSRFRILYLDPEETKPILFEYFDVKRNEKILRPMTLTDVIYLCCYSSVVKGEKMMYTVRYPIGDYLGSFFSKVFLLSTNDTTKIVFQDETYGTYPVVDLKLPNSIVSTLFVETVTPSNSRLAQTGGDYDGDTVKSIGMITDEANEQAEKLMYSKIYNVRPNCDLIYEIGIECVNGLYSLTKQKSKT